MESGLKIPGLNAKKIKLCTHVQVPYHCSALSDSFTEPSADSLKPLTKGSWIASYLVVGTRALQKRAHELGAIASVLLAYRNFFKEKYIGIPES